MKIGLILPMSEDDGRGTPSWPEIRDLALDGIGRFRAPR